MASKKNSIDSGLPSDDRALNREDEKKLVADKTR